MYKIKRFVKKIIKICKYIPVLWRDEDWDYAFILDLLELKLTRTRDCLRANNCLIGEQIRDITIGINQTLDHIRNYKDADNVYEDLYGCPINVSHVTVPAEKGYYKMITINNAENRRLTLKEDEEYTDFIVAQNKFEQKEWEAIWDTIKEQGQKWGD